MATGSKTAFTAEGQALAIPEILESILLELPFPDLLVNAQRVSHSWKRAIDSSPAIQQALFFQPATLEPNKGPHFNLLLQWAFPPWFDSNLKARHSRGQMFKRLPWSKSQAAFARKEASWRKMLPVQPAITILGVVSKIHYDGGTDVSVGEVEFDEGVRMGILYDFAYSNVAEPVSDFHVRYNIVALPDLRASDNGDGDSDMPLQDVLNTTESNYAEKDTITMKTDHTVQCCKGMKPDVGEEFRSEGFEGLIIEMRETITLC